MALPVDPLLPVLLARATFGFDQATSEHAQTIGWNAFIDEQLAPETIDDRACAERLAGFRSLSFSAREVRDDFDGPLKELRAAMIVRAVFSRRQLHERTVEFWNDHFTVDVEKGEGRLLKTVEDRTVIRAHAFGSFRDLLTAVAQSGAMLESLDNRANRKEAPNENFARELLELHTLGVGRYIERDVREVARCFTGWTIHARTDPRYGEFVFDPEMHDEGTKTVLGHAIDVGGIGDGLAVIEHLATHPATALNVVSRLCRVFIGESPPPAVVEHGMRAFIEKYGDIRAVLRAILRRDSFADAHSGQIVAYRRPLQLVAALLRATGAQVESADALIDELALLGHLPFAWPSPDGFPLSRDHWEAGLLARWRFVAALFGGRIAGVSIDLEHLLRDANRSSIDSEIDGLLTGGRLSANDRAVVRQRALAFERIEHAELAALFTLAASSPSFQEI